MNGYLKVKTICPVLRHGDVSGNQKIISEQIIDAYGMGANLVVFPELALSGDSGDLLTHPTLPSQCELALASLARLTKERNIMVIVGAPVEVDGTAHSCAVVLSEGKILAVISSTALATSEICFAHSPTLFGRDIIIKDREIGISVVVGSADLTEINRHHDSGASVVVNIFRAPRTVNSFKQALRLAKSTKNTFVMCGDCCTSASGLNSGVRLIAEAGEIMTASEGCDQSDVVFDVDIDLPCVRKPFAPFYYLGAQIHRTQRSARQYNRLPFVGKDRSVFRQALDILTDGIYHRLQHIGTDSVIFGLSGGIDSSYVAIVCNELCKKYNIPSSRVHAVIMPSVHSTSSQKRAQRLAEYFGQTVKKINIAKLSSDVLRLIGHQNAEDTTFENNQARLRTLILLNLGNMHNALMLGTSDMSEIALGFSTYGGDQFASLNVNAGLTKTFLQSAIRDYSQTHEGLRALLSEIVSQPISPELLPNQNTEDILGSYEINDFLLYYAVFRALCPKKVLSIACQTFTEVPPATLRQQLIRLLKRLCAFSFKKNASCDHIKVFEHDLNQLHLPSDISSTFLVEDILE